MCPPSRRVPQSPRKLVQLKRGRDRVGLGKRGARQDSVFVSAPGDGSGCQSHSLSRKHAMSVSPRVTELPLTTAAPGLVKSAGF